MSNRDASAPTAPSLAQALAFVRLGHLGERDLMAGVLDGLRAAAQAADHTAELAGRRLTIRRDPSLVIELDTAPSEDPASIHRMAARVLRKLAREGVSVEQLEHHVLSGLAQHLGPYAEYLPPGEPLPLAAQRVERSGLEWRRADASAWILGASPHGSPAHAAGVPAGARVLAVNGTSTKGKEWEDLRSLLDSPRIELLYEHAGQQRVATVERAAYRERFARLESLEEGVARVRLISFGEGVNTEVREMLEQIERVGPLQGLVLDLRSNTGGRLDEAQKLLDLFLGAGELWTNEESTRKVVSKTRDGDRFEALPIVLLVNGDSASASELATAALAGRERAVMLGSRTFGKGIGQSVFPLPNGGHLKFTTVRFLTPLGAYDGVGLLPHVCTAGVVAAASPSGAQLQAIATALAGLSAACGQESRWSELDEALAARIVRSPTLYQGLLQRSIGAQAAASRSRGAR